MASPSVHFLGFTLAHGWKLDMKSCPQVAVKVGCPTNNKMAACLKMTDPVKLTMAGSISLTSSPDSKAYTSHK